MARVLPVVLVAFTLLSLSASACARPHNDTSRTARIHAPPPINFHPRLGAENKERQVIMRPFPEPTAEHAGIGGADSSNLPLEYHGGKLMVNGVNLYLIWYGNWNQQSASASSQQLLRNFIASLGPKNPLTPGVNTVRGWFNTLLTFSQTVGGSTAYVSNQVSLGGEFKDNYSQGSSLNDDNSIANVVKNALNHLPSDQNGIYFVLPSPDVHVSLSTEAVPE